MKSINIIVLIKRGGGNGPMKPQQPSMRMYIEKVLSPASYGTIT